MTMIDVQPKIWPGRWHSTDVALLRFRRVTRCVLLLWSILIFVPRPALNAAKALEKPLSPETLFERVSPSVFIVEGLGPDGKVVMQGSGVVVAPQGVATNRHVVEGAASIRIRQGTRTWDAIVAHVDPAHDLCQLHVPGLTAHPVVLRNSPTLRPGARVYAIGAPKGLELTLSEGLISGFRKHKGDVIIQTTAPISPGSSGGGLFDNHGRLVGLTTFLIEESQNLNFALPGELIETLPTYPSKSPTKLPVIRPGLKRYWGGTPENEEQEVVYRLIQQKGLVPAFEWIRTEFFEDIKGKVVKGRSDTYKGLEESTRESVISCESNLFLIRFELTLVHLLTGDPKLDDRAVDQLAKSEEYFIDTRKKYEGARAALLIYSSVEDDYLKFNAYLRFVDEIVAAANSHGEAQRHLKRILRRLDSWPEQ